MVLNCGRVGYYSIKVLNSGSIQWSFILDGQMYLQLRLISDILIQGEGGVENGTAWIWQVKM